MVNVLRQNVGENEVLLSDRVPRLVDTRTFADKGILRVPVTVFGLHHNGVMVGKDDVSAIDGEYVGLVNTDVGACSGSALVEGLPSDSELARRVALVIGGRGCVSG